MPRGCLDWLTFFLFKIIYVNFQSEGLKKHIHIFFSNSLKSILKYFKKIFIWLCRVSIRAHWIFDFCCGMWDQVPWQGIKPRTSALGAQSLSHWTTRKILVSKFLNPLSKVSREWRIESLCGNISGCESSPFLGDVMLKTNDWKRGVLGGFEVPHRTHCNWGA